MIDWILYFLSCTCCCGGFTLFFLLIIGVIFMRKRGNKEIKPTEAVKVGFDEVSRAFQRGGGKKTREEMWAEEEEEERRGGPK